MSGKRASLEKEIHQSSNFKSQSINAVPKSFFSTQKRSLYEDNGHSSSQNYHSCCLKVNEHFHHHHDHHRHYHHGHCVTSIPAVVDGQTVANLVLNPMQQFLQLFVNIINIIRIISITRITNIIKIINVTSLIFFCIPH